jgi:hypothetical protein
MSVDTAFIQTHRGDGVTVTLFQRAGEEPTICISVDDADQCELPTFEMTISESSELREILRKYGEEVARHRRLSQFQGVARAR